jgi:hypothetical protein
LLESSARFPADSHGSGKKVCRAGLERFRRSCPQELAGCPLKRLKRDQHGLELCLTVTDERSEWHEPKVLVKLQLAGGAGNDCEIVTVLDGMLPEEGEQA